MTALADTDWTVAAPGVVHDMPNDVYHADPVPGGSLSSSGARRILTAPALFAYERENGQAHRDVFDFGNAAHKVVLGTGPDVAVVDAEDWRTKAARQAREDAYTVGAIPILAADWARVQAMADAIREHPRAGQLFRPGTGQAEVSLFWHDLIWRRARLDWLPEPTTGRLIVPDYKTTTSAHPAACAKAAHRYGYHQQAPWYLDALEALGISDDAEFWFVFQEKTPPYLITIAELDAAALITGRGRNRRAVETYMECEATGRWPGYSDDIELLALPEWAEDLELEI